MSAVEYECLPKLILCLLLPARSNKSKTDEVVCVSRLHAVWVLVAELLRRNFRLLSERLTTPLDQVPEHVTTFLHLAKLAIRKSPEVQSLARTGIESASDWRIVSGLFYASSKPIESFGDMPQTLMRTTQGIVNLSPSTAS